MATRPEETTLISNTYTNDSSSPAKIISLPINNVDVILCFGPLCHPPPIEPIRKSVGILVACYHGLQSTWSNLYESRIHRDKVRNKRIHTKDASGRFRQQNVQQKMNDANIAYFLLDRQEGWGWLNEVYLKNNQQMIILQCTTSMATSGVGR